VGEEGGALSPLAGMTEPEAFPSTEYSAKSNSDVWGVDPLVTKNTTRRRVRVPAVVKRDFE
jgi:hypothetical protein